MDDEHLRRPLGPYSEIAKCPYSEAYGPDPMFHSGADGNAFDFALPLDSPKSPQQVHERVDKEKGIMVDTDIMVEHVEDRR